MGSRRKATQYDRCAEKGGRKTPRAQTAATAAEAAEGTRASQALEVHTIDLECNGRKPGDEEALRRNGATNRGEGDAAGGDRPAVSEFGKLQNFQFLGLRSEDLGIR